MITPEGGRVWSATAGFTYHAIAAATLVAILRANHITRTTQAALADAFPLNDWLERTNPVGPYGLDCLRHRMYSTKTRLSRKIV